MTSARTTTRRRRSTRRCPPPRRRRPRPRIRRKGRPGWLRGALFFFRLPGGRRAEHVGVAVVDLERQRIDGGGVDPAALEAPAVGRRVPGSVLAACGRRLLAEN